MHDTMFFILKVSLMLWMLSLFSTRGSAYELQDTIHSLKEENLHLQHRLENLTHALRDLKHLLTEYSKVSGEGHDSEYQRAWKEWSQHGISPETHQMLEQALCFPDLHGAALSIFNTPGMCLLFSLLIIVLLLFLP